jgi:2-phospho-L-lactate guanylyltransferase
MSETIVIPFRGPRGAKTRLDAVLPEDIRESLALGLFRHVLSEVIDAGRGDILVVTTSPEAASHASLYGVDTLRETTGSLNAALNMARKSLAASEGRRLAVIAADLPLLTSDDVLALLAASDDGLAIAPDRSGMGTNALALPAAIPFTFRFGHKSLPAHRQQAARLNLDDVLVGDMGLAADLDQPSDLKLLNESFVRLSPKVRRAITRACQQHGIT